jgi:hypothetical protein
MMMAICSKFGTRGTAVAVSVGEGRGVSVAVGGISVGVSVGMGEGVGDELDGTQADNKTRRRAKG